MAFDCKDIYRENCFSLTIEADLVRVHEVYGYEPKATDKELAPEIVERSMITRRAWDAIAPDLAHELNRRLKQLGKRAGRWKKGVNGVQRLLGKEMLVLVWAVELATYDQIPTAIRSWSGLKPEERWWLYTMTAAATGAAEQRGEGWRAALHSALCVEPVRHISRDKTHLPSRSLVTLTTNDRT